MQFRYLVLGFCILLGSDLLAQSVFQKVFGNVNGSQGNAIISTLSGGYAIAGWYDVDGLFSAEFYVINLNAEGDTLWTKSFGKRADTTGFAQNGSGNEGYHLLQVADGGFLFVGERHEIQGGTSDAYAVRISPAGDLLWSRMYGGEDNEYGVSVAESADGHFVIGGFTETFGAGIRDMLLFKIDGDGDTLWTKTYGGPSIDAAMEMKQTADGGYILVGYTFSFGAGSSDVYVVRTDAAGNVLWQKTFGANLNEIGHSILETDDGGFVICGEAESFGAGNQDVYVLKISREGSLEWSKTYGGEDYEAGLSIAQSADLGYAIAGYTRGYGAGAEDFFLIKTNTNGDLEWAKTFGGPSDDSAKSILSANDKGFVMTGYTRSFGSGVLDVYLVKTDSLGQSTCGDSVINMNTMEVPTVEGIPSAAIGFGTIIKERNTVVGRTNTNLLDPCEIINNVVEFRDDNDYFLYPNPAGRLINIGYHGGTNGSDNRVVIYDVLGRVVMSDSMTDENHEVDISSLAEGPYYLTFEVGHNIISRMFIKQ